MAERHVCVHKVSEPFVLDLSKCRFRGRDMKRKGWMKEEKEGERERKGVTHKVTRTNPIETLAYVTFVLTPMIAPESDVLSSWTRYDC